MEPLRTWIVLILVAQSNQPLLTSSDSYPDPPETYLGNYTGATATVNFVLRQNVPSVNNRQIEIDVMRYEDDPTRFSRRRPVLLPNKVLFLADTMETGYACTVLEENDTVHFIEVQCRFARNENTRNVSKFDVLVEFTDLNQRDGVVPLPKTVSALVNFNKTDFNATENFYADPPEKYLGNYTGATATVNFALWHYVPSVNDRRIAVKVMRYEDDPDRPTKNHSVLLEPKEVLFVMNTTETGFACTVLEKNDTVNFTEVQCRFARNENTMNVSKFVVLVEFTDSGGEDNVPPIRAQINFHEPPNMDSTTPSAETEVTEDGTPTEDGRPTDSSPTTKGNDAQTSHPSWVGGFLTLLLLAIQYFR